MEIQIHAAINPKNFSGDKDVYGIAFESHSGAENIRDIVSIKLGDKVPVDALCLKEIPFKIVQVVLDLDEMLLCAYEMSGLLALLQSQAIESGIKCFELECTLSDKVVLDLDDMLVCAYETSCLPALLQSQAIESGIKYFELERTPSDKVLYFPLLKHLSRQEDVRPLLDETFHMPEWFQKHGIPSQHNQIL
ncbi:hypothetical protein LUZ63_017978 [Rhynchospora breviuscula]|uniref:Uncharacterized protein n=1 Tax=Rhynchospora breviuscula TaxID=2022672 RepID=A0A9Q0C3I5_9POAL|nr:hypothetical protein LUZ63_017978 [Rhynchospora breviuscula]